MPAFGRGNLFGSFIEYTEYVKTVTQLPVVLIHGLESHGLFCQDFRDVEKLAPPLDLAVMAHVPNGDSRLVFNLGGFERIRSWGRAIDTARGLSFQRLMGTLPVIFLLEGMILALLRVKIALRRHFLQRSVHPLVATVLRGFSRPDPLRLDPQLNPPLRAD